MFVILVRYILRAYIINELLNQTNTIMTQKEKYNLAQDEYLLFEKEYKGFDVAKLGSPYYTRDVYRLAGDAYSETRNTWKEMKAYLDSKLS